MIAMPELLRNILRRKLRTGLTVFGIAIGIFALVVLGAMAEKIDALVEGGQRYLSDRISIGRYHPFGPEPQLIPVEWAERVERVPSVACVETGIAILPEDAGLLSFERFKAITGIDIEQRRRCDSVPSVKFRVRFAQGDWWQRGERGVVVLGVDLAEELGARVGSSVSWRGLSLRVVGILERTLTGPDTMAFVPLEDARLILQLLGHSEASVSNMVTTIFAIPAPGVDADELARRIEAETDLNALGPSELVEELSAEGDLYIFIVIGAAVVALLVGGLSVINTMVMAVAERVREIGIKKAIGASDFDILREYMLEAALIGFVGGAVGLGLGSIAVRFLNDAALEATGTQVFVITHRLLAGSLVFATVLGTVAGFLPSFRAARLKPTEALKGE